MIQTFQKKVLRNIVDASRYARNSDSHWDLNIPYVANEIKHSAQKHQQRVREHVNPEVTQLKKILNDKIFGGKVDGLSVFITDDSAAEQAVIKTIWPKSKNLLCIFHVLQAVWKWLIKTKHGIPQEKQVLLYNQFKDILHAPTEKECFQKLEDAKKEAIHFHNYYKYLMDYWNRRKLWAKAYRNNLTILVKDGSTRRLKRERPRDLVQ
jgi:hypothetical protein